MNRRVAARDFESELVRARARADDLGHALDRASDLDLPYALARSLGSARNLARALPHHLARARTLARSLVSALDLARARDLVLAYKRVNDLDLALERLRDLEQYSAASASARVTPGRVSRGVVALAVRLLPAAQRPRYAAELRGELVELRRRERCGYALRVLVGAWEFRRALVVAVQTQDGDVARRAER